MVTAMIEAAKHEIEGKEGWASCGSMVAGSAGAGVRLYLQDGSCERRGAADLSGARETLNVAAPGTRLRPSASAVAGEAMADRPAGRRGALRRKE